MLAASDLTRLGQRPTLRPALTRFGVLGLYLEGVLLATPGCLLVGWGYHLQPTLKPAANFFLATGLGYLAANRIRGRWKSRFAFPLAIALAWLGVLSGVRATPAAYWVACCLLGASISLFQLSATDLLREAGQQDSGSTLDLVGVSLQAGIVSAPTLASLVWPLGTYGPLPLVLLLAPLSLFVAAKASRSARVSPDDPPDGPVPLLHLLVACEAVGEGCLTAWLPVFLVHRLGAGPTTALHMLAVYGLLLLIGRVLALWLLQRVRRRWLLLSGLAAAFFGAVCLGTAANGLGALVGLALVSMPQALAYPIVLTRLRPRLQAEGQFVSLLRSLLRVAVLSALLGAWLFGQLAPIAGVRVLALVPLLAAVATLCVSTAILVRAHLTEPVRLRPAAA